MADSSDKPPLGTFEAAFYRGSNSWLTVGLAAFFVWSGVTALIGDAEPDPNFAASAFVAAGAMACLFVGSRAQSRLVQRLGLALFVVWLVLLFWKPL